MPEIIYRKLKDLKLLGNNPRQIGKPEFETLCKSVADNPDYFEARPLILSDRTGELVTIAGNMRYRAAKHNKQKEVPTILLSGLTEEREAEIIIRDNVNNGAWDFDQIANSWTDYPLSDWGLDVPDFEVVEEAGTADAEPQIDKAAELNKKWGVVSGDLWQIGEHRLLCGDSTNPLDLDKLLDGVSAEMMFTDPPYGVNYEGGHFHSGDVNIKREREKLAADETTAIYFDFLPITLPRVDGPCYMWFADTKAGDVYNAVHQSNCEVHALLIWHKINATYAAMNAQYKQRHEPCLYFKPKGSTLRWCGASTEATLWEIKRDGQNEFHPTQKPIELAMKALGNHDAKTVLDVFGGSGSTMVAAENCHRRSFLLEISENYCAVILQRMSDAFPDLEIKRIEQAATAKG